MTDEELIARLNNIKSTVLFAALRKIEQQTAWRNAVIDELTSLHIYSAEHDADPRKAVLDIIEWNQRLALDPAVSAEARALMVRGGEMVKEAAATVSPTKTAADECETVGQWTRRTLREAIRALSVPAIVEVGDETR